MSAALDHLAERVKSDPWFLAHPLAEYARSAGLDDVALAAKLGCAVADLTAVRLCRAPQPDTFRADLTVVAECFGLNLFSLLAAVQHGTGLARLREGTQAGADAGWQIAAQDRETPG
ncbi:MAG TPA: hypothetical protein VD866_02985 [Urbifossiella sp.]|nr:hypothetical protein [Urbifossiella sp.]